MRDIKSYYANGLLSRPEVEFCLKLVKQHQQELRNDDKNMHDKEMILSSVTAKELRLMIGEIDSYQHGNKKGEK